MRVLLFPKDFPSAQRPGAGIFILRRAQALRDLGHEIEVVRIVPYAPNLGKKWSAYHAVPAVEEVDGFAVRTIRAFVPPRMIGMEYLAVQVLGALRREISRFRPDIVHASFLIPCGQIAVRMNVPAVVTAHGGDAYSWPQRRPGLMRAAREAITQASRVTVVSEYIGRCVRSISPREVDVIWNGGDERFFYPRDRAQSRQLLQLPDDRIVIAFAGNILRAKGVFELADAAASMRELRPIVALAGTGSDSIALADHARTLGIDLRLLGRLEPDQVGELFGAADIVTLPSYNEGLPNVVCEAMLSQRPVVATTAGGIPEIVRNGQTGLLVPPRDAPALAAALLQMARNVELRGQLEKRARAFAVEHLTWRVSAQKYDQVYREVLSAL